jgi:acyl-CoA reductase-like NAD-dependent aldehyde dehydrogenase
VTATTSAPAFKNYIAGEWRPAASGETTENRSPANVDDLIGTFASSDAADVDAAISSAAEAFESWRKTSPITRANILFKAAEIMASRQSEIGKELTREEGKTLKEGVGETGRAIQILRYVAGEIQQPSGEHYPSMNPQTLLYTVREPLGPVAIITPWNFPIAIPAWKIAPGDRVRQHRRLQAREPDPADRGPAGRGVARGRAAGGRGQPRDRERGQGRQRAGA